MCLTAKSKYSNCIWYLSHNNLYLTMLRIVLNLHIFTYAYLISKQYRCQKVKACRNTCVKWWQLIRCKTHLFNFIKFGPKTSARLDAVMWLTSELSAMLSTQQSQQLLMLVITAARPSDALHSPTSWWTETRWDQELLFLIVGHCFQFHWAGKWKWHQLVYRNWVTTLYFDLPRTLTHPA